MSYNINGLGYDSRNEALTTLVADYVSGDIQSCVDEMGLFINSRELAENMAREMSLEMGAGEAPTNTDELADHIQAHNADIIEATA